MKTFAAALVAGLSALAPVAAQADDILSADPRIENGRLTITGVAAAPGIRIRLDGQAGAAFNVTAGSGTPPSFTFNLSYLPSDCIVTLQKVTGITLGAPTNWVVADCGPRGLSPRGAWNSTAFYVKNDLVTFQGSSWRAKRDNSGSQPGTGTAWEQFASKGAIGPEGPQGPPGQDGAFVGQRAVTKVCNDTGGWVKGSGFIYCIASCAPGEVAFDAMSIVTGRGNPASVSTPPGTVFNPSAISPFPRDRWYANQIDSSDGNGHSLNYSQVTVRIICGPPP